MDRFHNLSMRFNQMPIRCLIGYLSNFIYNFMIGDSMQIVIYGMHMHGAYIYIYETVHHRRDEESPHSCDEEVIRLESVMDFPT